MADLDPAHVEAVARAMIEVAYHDIAIEFSLTFLPTGDNRASVPAHWEGDALVKAEHYAKALMESTDPAVHAALLAVLVRAGVLDVEPWRVLCTCGQRLEASPDEVEAWVREHDDSPLSKHRIVWNPPSPRPWKRRYVTRWEDA